MDVASLDSVAPRSEAEVETGDTHARLVYAIFTPNASPRVFQKRWGNMPASED